MTYVEALNYAHLKNLECVINEDTGSVWIFKPDTFEVVKHFYLD